MVWMHPNGYLMSRQEGGWNIEQAPSHSQPVKVRDKSEAVMACESLQSVAGN